jgi:hypothetical protein
VADLFAAAQSHFPGESLRLALDRDLVVSLECGPCRSHERVMKPLPRVGVSRAACPRCGEIMRPEIVHVIEADSALSRERLAAVGIPSYDIVRVEGSSSQKTFLLAGDRQTALG